MGCWSSPCRLMLLVLVGVGPNERVSENHETLHCSLKELSRGCRAALILARRVGLRGLGRSGDRGQVEMPRSSLRLFSEAHVQEGLCSEDSQNIELISWIPYALSVMVIRPNLYNWPHLCLALQCSHFFWVRGGKHGAGKAPEWISEVGCVYTIPQAGWVIPKLHFLMAVSKVSYGRNQGRGGATEDTQPCRGALWWEVPLTLPWGKLRHHFQSELKATEIQVTAAPGYN